MSHTALIRFAPLVSIERINDPRWQRPGRTIYDPGALQMLPGKTSCPLLIDHDVDRVVGSVRSLSRMEDTDGPWLVAHATIERCPEWLRTRETPASFEYAAPRQTRDFGCEITRHGWVTEVSLVSPASKPAEPLARVVGLWEDVPVPPVVRRSRRDEKAESEMVEFRRRLDAAGPNGNFERILRALKYELGYESDLAWGVR